MKSDHPEKLSCLMFFKRSKQELYVDTSSHLYPSTQETETGGLSEIKANLDYTRPCLKKTNQLNKQTETLAHNFHG